MKKIAFLLSISLHIVSCRATGTDVDNSTIDRSRLEVTAAMERYQEAARTTNPDAIASFYTNTGVLFEPGIEPIVTKEKIRAFIASFPGVRVDVATATPDVIEVFGDTAFYWGSYFERLAFPGQPLSEQHGKFVAEWLRQADGKWLMQRLFRIPTATQEQGAAEKR